MKAILAGAMLACSIIVPGCSRDAGVVGSYIGGDASARMMLQIASVKDHDVRGKLIAVITDRTGKVTAVDKAVEGTIEAGAVNLNLETGAGLSLLTGKMTDDGLELTMFVGNTSQKLAFVRSDPNEFAGLVDGVRKSAAQIKQASAQEAARQTGLRRAAVDQARIDAFSTDMAARSDRLADSTLRIGALSSGYRSTAAQAARLAGQRATLAAGAGDGDYRLDQISWARERNSDAAATRHDTVTDALKSLAPVVSQHEADAASMMALCQGNHDLDCSRVGPVMSTYRMRVAAFREAGQREQSIYATERSKF